MKIYVEGGGDSKELKTRCRRGFSNFFEKAGLKGRMPRVVACGSRNDAFDSFCTALANKEEALLLVDSEELVAAEYQMGNWDEWKPWDHLKSRDNWNKPDRSQDLNAHLMVVCMETWFLTDRETLANYFGQDFQPGSLPKPDRPIESIPKHQLFAGLSRATTRCKKGKYGKGAHSFEILELIDVESVVSNSPWADRLVRYLVS